MSKKYLSVAFAYVGVIIGAGLASGQDLLQYFLSFGAKGLIGIAALGVLNVVFGVVALQLGSYYRSGHHDEVFERITHPALRRVIDEAEATLGSVRGVGVRRVLRALDVERVSVSADVCRDIDTPEDVAWWETFLSN